MPLDSGTEVDPTKALELYLLKSLSLIEPIENSKSVRTV